MAQCLGFSTRAFLTASVASLTLSSGSAFAQSVPKVINIDIAAQPLAAALSELGREANISILFSPQSVAGLMAPAVRGAMSPNDAVRRLISRTLLQVIVDNRGALIVRSGPKLTPVAVSEAPIAAQGAGQERQGGSTVPPATLSDTASQTTASQAGASMAAASGQGDLVGEVVVTATRQSTSANKTPLSLTVLTERALDQQSINTVQDITRVVPGLTLRYTDNNALNPEIRGIISTTGSPTTGVYLDDTALQKRSGTGSAVGNGTPFPPLFDLDRIEVLRGPQGTLFGGSSEGGTIRFITPSPSLTAYSVYAKTEAGGTDGGSPSYEAGVAVGGPIVQDKLGFRVSVYDQHLGGYLDHINQYTQATVAENSNYEDSRQLRGALAWAPTDRFKITAAAFWSSGYSADASPFWLDQGAVTTPTRYYSATSATASLVPTAKTTFVYPSHTYGPYDFYGPGKAGGDYTSPARNGLFTPSLTLDYDFGAVQLKNILSYIADESEGVDAFDPSTDVTPFQAGIPYVAELPDYASLFYYENKRHGFSEEVRLSSAPNSSPISFVTGLYFSSTNTESFQYTTENLNQLSETLTGLPAITKYGAYELPGNVATSRYQTIYQREIAGYSQVNWAVTSKLKLTAGVRVSSEYLDYYQLVDGPIGGYDNVSHLPTTANGGIAIGTEKSLPVTPKFGVDYQLTPNDLLYASAAQGFRQGGVNVGLPQSCAAAATAAGFATGTPQTYQPDSLWSYEGGGKLRLFGGRAQLNASAFYIDWSKIQFTASVPGCNFTLIENAAKAVSKGFDVQGSVRVIDGLVVDYSVAYTDAQYTAQVNSPGSTTSVLIGKGNYLPTSPWDVELGAQYNFSIMSRKAYIRADYQFQSSFKNGTGPGTVSYQPDIYNNPATNFANARVGMIYKGVDLSLFVKNLANSQDILNYIGLNAGRYGCSAATGAACMTYSNYNPLTRAVTFRPREIGLTATYRY